MQLPIALPKDKLTEFCQRNHIRKLSLYGSILRNDFHSDSDIDILVEFIPGNKVSYFDLSRMERELSRMLNGRVVDLHTPAELSHYFRDRVLSEAVVQYGA
jgi:uncharacterized protein